MNIIPAYNTYMLSPSHSLTTPHSHHQPPANALCHWELDPNSHHPKVLRAINEATPRARVSYTYGIIKQLIPRQPGNLCGPVPSIVDRLPLPVCLGPGVIALRNVLWLHPWQPRSRPGMVIVVVVASSPEQARQPAHQAGSCLSSVREAHGWEECIKSARNVLRSREGGSVVMSYLCL